MNINNMVKYIINKNLNMSILMILSAQFFLFSCEKNYSKQYLESQSWPIDSKKDQLQDIFFSLCEEGAKEPSLITFVMKLTPKALLFTLALAVTTAAKHFFMLSMNRINLY